MPVNTANRRGKKKLESAHVADPSRVKLAFLGISHEALSALLGYENPDELQNDIIDGFLKKPLLAYFHTVYKESWAVKQTSNNIKLPSCNSSGTGLSKLIELLGEPNHRFYKRYWGIDPPDETWTRVDHFLTLASDLKVELLKDRRSPFVRRPGTHLDGSIALGETGARMYAAIRIAQYAETALNAKGWSSMPLSSNLGLRVNAQESDGVRAGFHHHHFQAKANSNLPFSGPVEFDKRVPCFGWTQSEDSDDSDDDDSLIASTQSSPRKASRFGYGPASPPSGLPELRMRLVRGSPDLLNWKDE